MDPTIAVDVNEAIRESHSRHPGFILGSDGDRTSVILGEEYGETCRANLELNRHGPSSEGVHKLYHELSQVAATAIQWMDYIRRTGCQNQSPSK